MQAWKRQTLLLSMCDNITRAELVSAEFIR
jgi:hypothetical protein